jgi:hypothetical protein
MHFQDMVPFSLFSLSPVLTVSGTSSTRQLCPLTTLADADPVVSDLPLPLSRPDPASRGSFALRHARGRRKARGDSTPWGAPSGWSSAGAPWRSAAAAAASRSAPMTGRWIEQERSGEVDADPGGQQHLGPCCRLRRRLGRDDAADAGKDGEEAAPTAPPPPRRLLAFNSRLPAAPSPLLPSALAPPPRSSPPIGGGSQLLRPMRERMRISSWKSL